MNREELENAICDEIGMEEWRRTRSRGLGNAELTQLEQGLQVYNTYSHWYRRHEKWKKRKRIAQEVGIERTDHENPFRMDELEVILDRLQNPPPKNTWDAVLA